MTSVFTKKLKVDVAEQFKEAASETSPTTIYLSIGRGHSWIDDANPNTANSSVATEYEIWSNMIGAKKITSNDIRHVIPRYDWVANTKYIAYDHLNTNLYGDNVKFYVLTTDNHVFKCLANNNSANSTVQPTSVSYDATTQTSDGYTWKYMYSLSDADLLKFTTGGYIPVKTLDIDDGSLQWDVQENAIPGAIHSIVIENAGVGYSNADDIIVTITGDGTTATATATINATSNTLSSITLTNIGLGYSNAKASLIGGGGAGGILRPIISYPGGHGSDPLYELGGSNLMINVRLNNTENGVLPESNEFRQIALIKNPLTRGTSNVASNSVVLQAYTITTSGTGSYESDEIVYQGASLASATFTGRVLTYDAGVVTLTSPAGIISTSTLVGANSATARLPSSYTFGELEKNSGYVLYTDNIRPITRSADQTEDFKILIRL